MCWNGLPDCLTRNAIRKTLYIAIFTTVAAVFTTSALAYGVISKAREDDPPSGTDPSVRDVLYEQKVVGIVALVVNIGWLVVAVILIVAVKTTSAYLCLPFLLWGILYIPFCLGVIITYTRRLCLLPDSEHHLKPSLYGGIVMCLVAPLVYCIFLVLVEQGRRQMQITQNSGGEIVSIKLSNSP